VQAALVEDAGEHRERGDAHGRAEEERERQEADARRRERRVEERGEGGAEQEGCDDARVAHRDGRVGPPAQQREVEAQADDEHVQEHAELAQGGQRHHAVGREERGEGAWGHRSKHRRPERQPGDHLADHRRLPQRAHQCPRHAGGEQDDDELSEEQAEVEHTERRGCRAPDAPSQPEVEWPRRRPGTHRVGVGYTVGCNRVEWTTARWTRLRRRRLQRPGDGRGDTNPHRAGPPPAPSLPAIRCGRRSAGLPGLQMVPGAADRHLVLSGHAGAPYVRATGTRGE
jgi:hypothetical protein